MSSLYFFISTYGFNQCICYDQAITMIYRGHMIDKMADVYKNTFPVRSKKRVHCFVAGELLLVFKYVIDVR